jgi:hypothetical protein
MMTDRDDYRVHSYTGDVIKVTPARSGRRDALRWSTPRGRFESLGLDIRWRHARRLHSQPPSLCASCPHKAPPRSPAASPTHSLSNQPGWSTHSNVVLKRRSACRWCRLARAPWAWGATSSPLPWRCLRSCRGRRHTRAARTRAASSSTRSKRWLTRCVWVVGGASVVVCPCVYTVRTGCVGASGACKWSVVVRRNALQVCVCMCTHACSTSSGSTPACRPLVLEAPRP